MGMTPANNPHAVRYALGVGMQKLGTLPNVFYDAHDARMVGAVVTYLTLAMLAEQAEAQQAGG
jgi:hypothetical protein